MRSFEVFVMSKFVRDVFTMNAILSKIDQLDAAVHTFVRMWSYDQKLYPKLFDLLGFKLEDNNMRINPFDLVQPQSCSIDMKTNRLEFNTLLYNLSANYQILQMVPFVLLRDSEEDGNICIMKYKGPQYAVFRFALQLK